MKINKQIVIEASDRFDAEIKANLLATTSEVLTANQLEGILPIIRVIKQKIKNGAGGMALLNEGTALLNILKQD